MSAVRKKEIDTKSEVFAHFFFQVSLPPEKGATDPCREPTVPKNTIARTRSGLTFCGNLPKAKIPVRKDLRALPTERLFCET